MSIWNALVSALFATLSFSWIALIIAALPPACVGVVLRTKETQWVIPASSEIGERKVHYVAMALLGGLAGEFCAIFSLLIDSWWWCRTNDQVCHDGQAGMVLIITVPALSLLGSMAALLWTWVSIRVPANKLWTSVFRYSGSHRFLNWICAIAIQFIFWTLVTLTLCRLTV